MNREIKFRAWDKERNEMYYPSSLHCHFRGNTAFNSTRFSGDDYSILMQYVGLKDKNGKEIYEGDIVKLHDTWEDTESLFCTFIVKISQISNLYFEVLTQTKDFKKIYSYDRGDDPKFGYWVYPYMEVIGNVYENLELLK